MNPIVPALLTGLLLGGPAAAAEHLSARAQAGRAVALERCASCHAVEATGASPNPHSTPFREIARVYDDRMLDSEFDAIARMGHYEMPPIVVAPGDRRALIAYIAQFRGLPLER
jgi:mono/diheme cytochrome c family protein